MKRLVIAAAALTAGLLAVAPARAQTAEPAAASPAPIAGFSAHGTLSIAVNLPNAPAPMGLTAEIAVMTKSRRVRFDVLKFASTGTDKGTNDVVSHFLPTGAISIVFDQQTRVFTMWSEQKREYYQSKTASTPKPKPAPKATPAPSIESPVDQVLKAMRAVTEYDSFTETLSLVGHQPVNGHTASVYHLTMQGQKHGGKPYDFTSDMAFADDLSGIPVRMWFVSKGAYDGSMKLDLLSASTAVPDPNVFTVPGGYKKVTSLMELFSTAP